MARISNEFLKSISSNLGMAKQIQQPHRYSFFTDVNRHLLSAGQLGLIFGKEGVTDGNSKITEEDLTNDTLLGEFLTEASLISYLAGTTDEVSSVTAIKKFSMTDPFTFLGDILRTDFENASAPSNQISVERKSNNDFSLTFNVNDGTNDWDSVKLLGLKTKALYSKYLTGSAQDFFFKFTIQKADENSLNIEFGLYLDDDSIKYIEDALIYGSTFKMADKNVTISTEDIIKGINNIVLMDGETESESLYYVYNEDLSILKKIPAVSNNEAISLKGALIDYAPTYYFEKLDNSCGIGGETENLSKNELLILVDKGNGQCGIKKISNLAGVIGASDFYTGTSFQVGTTSTFYCDPEKLMIKYPFFDGTDYYLPITKRIYDGYNAYNFFDPVPYVRDGANKGVYRKFDTKNYNVYWFTTAGSFSTAEGSYMDSMSDPYSLDYSYFNSVDLLNKYVQLFSPGGGSVVKSTAFRTSYQPQSWSNGFQKPSENSQKKENSLCLVTPPNFSTPIGIVIGESTACTGISTTKNDEFTITEELIGGMLSSTLEDGGSTSIKDAQKANDFLNKIRDVFFNSEEGKWVNHPSYSSYGVGRDIYTYAIALRGTNGYQCFGVKLGIFDESTGEINIVEIVLDNVTYYKNPSENLGSEKSRIENYTNKKFFEEIEGYQISATKLDGTEKYITPTPTNAVLENGVNSLEIDFTGIDKKIIETSVKIKDKKTGEEL